MRSSFMSSQVWPYDTISVLFVRPDRILCLHQATLRYTPFSAVYPAYTPQVTVLSGLYVCASPWFFFYDADKGEICPST